MSYIYTAVSNEPDHNLVPALFVNMHLIMSVLSCYVIIDLPEVVSMHLLVLSADPVSSFDPSVVKLRHLTDIMCSLKVHMHSPVVIRKDLILKSAEQVNSLF